jgi:hypothetical protein
MVIAGRRRVALLGACGFCLLIVVVAVIGHSGLTERPTALRVTGLGSSSVATLSNASCTYMHRGRGGLEVSVSGKITTTTDAPLGMQLAATTEQDGKTVGYGGEFLHRHLTRGDSMNFQMTILYIPLISNHDHCVVSWNLPLASG